LGQRSGALENMVIDQAFWQGKRVLLTGHSGFKGGWLALWLQQLGANVYGYALPPDTEPDLYYSARIAEGMAGEFADIRDVAALRGAFERFKPEIVFHLAAQPLVRRSYQEPLQTYEINVMGSLQVLECLRAVDSVQAALLITTDKCYENQGWHWAYREGDALGGYDPYSSSKACMEILVSCYRRSFFAEGATAIATARAGNVIGGGDWSEDRLIPDFVRAKIKRSPVRIRNPQAVRPWQHVLDPLAGYLCLAERLYRNGADYASAWNFGPDRQRVYSVGQMAEQALQFWPDLQYEPETADQPHEAAFLTLDSSKAERELAWRVRWSVPQALDQTLQWYQAYFDGADMRAVSLQQIQTYSAQAAMKGSHDKQF
jgi:CDP-glucose 4,6-dehydratase